jgi:hypothetical protein
MYMPLDPSIHPETVDSSSQSHLPRKKHHVKEPYVATYLALPVRTIIKKRAGE